MMEPVTEASIPVEQANRTIEVLATGYTGNTPMLITNKYGDTIYVYLSDENRAALIKALGGTA